MAHHPNNWFIRILLVVLVAALLFVVPAAIGAEGLSATVDAEAETHADAEAATSGIPPATEAVTSAAAEAQAEGEAQVNGLTATTEEVHVTTEEAASVAAQTTSNAESSSTDELTFFSNPTPTSEVAAASAAVATAAAGAGFLFWLKNGIGLAAGRFLGAPLFSRLSKDEMLQNDGREALFNLVESNPGIGLAQLADKSGLGWGTTVYHLGRLEQAGFISSMKNGQARHFFKNGHPAAQSKKAVAVLKNKTAADLGRFLLATPGATGKTIAKGLGIAAPTVTKYVQRLEAEGLVETLKEGRTKIVQPTALLSKAMGHIEPPMPEMPAPQETPSVLREHLSAYA